MGMTSPEILKLIQSCPKGAEALVLHIVHILTEQSKLRKIFLYAPFFSLSLTIT
jgi:hypothetical protein